MTPVEAVVSAEVCTGTVDCLEMGTASDAVATEATDCFSETFVESICFLVALATVNSKFFSIELVGSFDSSVVSVAFEITTGSIGDSTDGSLVVDAAGSGDCRDETDDEDESAEEELDGELSELVSAAGLFVVGVVVVVVSTITNSDSSMIG